MDVLASTAESSVKTQWILSIGKPTVIALFPLVISRILSVNVQGWP